MFSKKFSSNIRKKKRMIILSIILLMVFLTTGYAVFTTNLGINGTLNVSKYDHTLYGVLEKAYRQGYAHEYTGEHQDSMAGVGNEKIYHWWAPDTTAGNTRANEILDKNNVIFANHCWQMIRTTDTGGVKMIYNGEPENNQCLNTRGNHVGYSFSSMTTQSMSTTYYYGTSYIYDSTNNVFSLDGTVTTGTIQPGQYTCCKTTSTGTCATLYLVDTLSSGTTYNVFRLNGNSNYSRYGTLPINQVSNSPASGGYMYNIDYPIVGKDTKFYITEPSSMSINSNYYYSDTIDYGNINANKYTLINPIRVSTLSDYSELIGKYYMISSQTSYKEVRYIINVNGTSAYYKILESGDLNTSLTIGESYTKSGNTYTLTNSTNVTYIDWYNNISDYTIYKGKYVCGGNNTSCNILKRITTISDPTKAAFNYYDTNNTYSYAKSINYSEGIYTLSGDVKNIWDLTDSDNRNSISTHHYTCLENGISCATVGYVFQISSDYYYIELSDGANISVAITNMLNNDNVNVKNSTIKTGIDAWYKRYMTSYTSQLEDTIFCYDRSIISLGAWDPEGSVTDRSSVIKFKGSNKNKDLSCMNETDKFSMSNTKAQLTYPVGLLTHEEIILSSNLNIRKAPSYWTFSLDSVQYSGSASAYYVTTSNSYNVVGTGSDEGVRPAVSLKPGTEYVSGTGSMADPYVVE